MHQMKPQKTKQLNRRRKIEIIHIHIPTQLHTERHKKLRIVQIVECIQSATVNFDT